MTRVDTRQKILDVSRELFNKNGTAETSTNHIAAKAGISPGNLYYYYKNKEEIVYELFQQMLGIAENVWNPEEPHEMTLIPDEKKTAGAIELFMGLMELAMYFFLEYRFFFQDFSHIMRHNEKLVKSFRLMIQNRLAITKKIFLAMQREGLVKELSEDEIEALSHRSWIVSSYWFEYSEFMGHRANESTMREGVRQMIFQLVPYSTEKGKSFWENLMKKYETDSKESSGIIKKKSAKKKRTEKIRKSPAAESKKKAPRKTKT